MKLYLDMAVILNFLVDFLLLLGANRLAGFPWGTKRCLLGAAVGGLYGGACLLPGFSFLGNGLWRVVFLGLMGGAAYGFRRDAVKRILLVALLSFALGGAALGLEKGSFFGILSVAFLVAAVCGLGFRAAGQELVEVELLRGEKRLKLLALRDTGNSLTDPVTGKGVLVADAQSAETLLGLTKAQLSDPVGTMDSGILPGLRLIPYRAIGVAGGFLLAVRLEGVRVGNKNADTLVAFAPEGLGGKGTYRALIGGMA
jgi:stage II sporulation protein GA (sporulation sigma-E factor processing peptidase)